MAAITTYADALRFHDELTRSGMKLGLDNTYRLLAAVGDPHRQLRCIHVAGTNGKGSVCALLTGALVAAGLRTGLTISPHLANVRERFQVDGVAISEAEFTALTAEMVERAAALFAPERGHTPTYFEFATVLAFLYFVRRQVDVAVVEVGLGGRLDSTNVITPLVSVITTIDLDHMHFLGDTRAAIAGEKAGIIKPGVPVVCGEADAEPLGPITAVAAAQHAPLHRVGVDFAGVDCADVSRSDAFLQRNTVRWQGTTRTCTTRLLGRHQLNNLAVAHATLHVAAAQGLPLDLERAAAGFSTVVWPGRLQLMPDGVVIDGSHNAAGMRPTAQTLQARYPGRRYTVLFGALQGKTWQGMLDALAPIVDRIHLVRVPNDRAEDPVVERAYLEQHWPGLYASTVPTPRAGLALLRASGCGLVTGSLYLAGDILGIYYDGQPAPLLLGPVR